MTLVYVALIKQAQTTSVMGVFTSATDAHEATKKHQNAWFEPCRLNGYTEFGESLVKIRQQVGRKDTVWRPVGLVQVDPVYGSNASVSSVRKSRSADPAASAPNASTADTESDGDASLSKAR